KLLELIDYASFTVNNENPAVPMMREILTLNHHYSCIPQTPLFYLCRQHIRSLANLKFGKSTKSIQWFDRDF
ncbi:unnamed protein product, partial [Didymodactylos carnosus]